MIDDWKVSIRRACAAIMLDRPTYHYKSRRPDQAALEKRIKEICETRVRYGYRRIHTLLVREGWTVNHKKVRRIYNELGLQLRNKTPKRRVKAKLREDRRPAEHPHETWAIAARQAIAKQMPRGDFVHDNLATGHKLRILTVIDTYTRFVPIIDPRLSYKGENVVQTLDAACRKHGYPKNIRVDNGPEFISKDLDLWAYQNDVTLDFSRPGKPTDNAFIESFNGSLRAECLNTHWFMNLADARQKLEAWRKDYNEVRPHSSIGNKSPIMLINHPDEPSPSDVMPPGNSTSGW